MIKDGVEVIEHCYGTTDSSEEDERFQLFSVHKDATIMQVGSTNEMQKTEARVHTGSNVTVDRSSDFVQVLESADLNSDDHKIQVTFYRINPDSFGAVHLD